MPDPIVADPAAPVADPPPPDPAPVVSDDAAVDGDDAQLDERSQKTIAAIRNDFKRERSARQSAEAKARQAPIDARAALAQEIGKALGLVPEDVSDPAKLLEQSNVFKAQARQSAVELAVYRAADSANGDPAALLDSRLFLAKVAEIDPTDATALAAAITEAVAGNPRLGKPTPPPGGMKPNPAQGSSASPALGLDAQIRAAEQSGDMKTSMRLKAARQLELSQADRLIR